MQFDMNGNQALSRLLFLCCCLLLDPTFGLNHAILYPKVFRIDTAEKVVVNLHGYESTRVNVHAQLGCNGQADVKEFRASADNAILPIQFEVQVPGDWFDLEYLLGTQKVTLRIQISFTNGRYRNIVIINEIDVSGVSDNIFVMTNRPIYKPGEEVMIRAAALDPNMLLSSLYDRVKLSVETESGIGIWSEERYRQGGFFSSRYRTTELTPPGTYFVVARISRKGHFSTGKAKFVIKKYVLPSFDVKINIDKNTVAPTEDIRGSFVARYSYGNYVPGQFSYKATLHLPGNSTSVVIDRYPIDPERYMPGIMRGRYAGKGTIRVRTSSAARKTGKTWDELIEARATISVTVSVRGNADGVVRSHRVDGILITNSPYAIDVSDSSRYFVPGLQHILYVVIRDVVTRDTVQENVDVTVLRTDNGERQTYQTDTRGILRGIVQTNVGNTHIPVNISVDGTTVSLVLRPQNIAQGFLRVISDKSFLMVGERLIVEFRTQSSSVPDKIQYMVLCRGSIISFDSVDTSGQPMNRVEFEITRKMSPMIRIVGYFVRGDNIISDSTSVTVEEVCISEELNIRVTPVNNQVHFRLEGQPNANFVTRAVDKAALLLNEEGRIEPDDMFQYMKESDMGCSNGGGTDAIDVFKDAGLSAITKRYSTPSHRSLNCSVDGNARSKRSVDLNLDTPSDEREFLAKCYLDGKKVNLGGLHCPQRADLVRNFLNEDLLLPCLLQFEQGCAAGELFRATLQFRTKHSRTESVRFDSDSVHTTVTISNRRRFNFDEGWLWLNGTLDQNGYGDLHTRTPPDSITTHQVDAISVHETEGACIAQPVEIRVLKKVFVKLFLPYSIKIMEEIQLRAAIFNYEDRTVTVRLRIKTDKFVCSRASQGQFHDQGQVSITNGSSASFQFTVVPIKVPSKNKKSRIVAEVVSLDGSLVDAVERIINIENSGELQDFSRSYLLDPTVAGQRHILDLNFPDDDILPGSRNCEIYGYMSYLGPLIEFDPIEKAPRNLKGSVKVPWGCGEQNMMTVGPNVFVYKYMKREEGEIAEEDIQKYITAGYTREINHMNNRRWSVYSSSSPTIWLNAYVNKVFLHALEVWNELNMDPICDSLRWLVAQQKPSGEFSELVLAKHYWINVAEGGDISLTAYVLVSVSENTINCGDDGLHQDISSMKIHATRYLQQNIDRIPNDYTAALVTYALSLISVDGNEATRANARLLDQRIETGDEIYWRSSTDVNKNVKLWGSRQQQPINIEATAYALLAQVTFAKAVGQRIDQGTVDSINKIARWMVNQQNDRGGFVTSQTTVIAIQSMAEYATWIGDLEPFMEEPHLDITLTSEGTSLWSGGHLFSLDNSNRLYRKNITVPEDVLKNSRQIIASNINGVGRGQLSYRCTFRTTRDPEPVCDYNINVETKLDGEKLTLKLKVSKISHGKSAMAIIDVSLMSGYQPVEDTLEAIKRGPVMDGTIDDYEITATKVLLYVEKIESGSELPLVLGFEMSKNTKVTNPNPAKIHVYDYYHPDESQCTTFYAEPDDSPSILKYCQTSGNSPGDQSLCKCMDGGCPLCRTWSDQVNTTCVGRCGDEEFNLLCKTCYRNYAFIITIKKLDNESMPLYVKMESIITENLYHRDINETESGQMRTFIIYKGCFDIAKNAKGGPYFQKGSSYLIQGKMHDTRPISSGAKRIDYLMDKDTIVEKAVPNKKCRKAKSNKSAKANERRVVCSYQRKFRKQLGNQACENTRGCR